MPSYKSDILKYGAKSLLKSGGSFVPMKDFINPYAYGVNRVGGRIGAGMDEMLLSHLMGSMDMSYSKPKAKVAKSTSAKPKARRGGALKFIR